ncbi:hypothetical protein Tco_0990299 [Tanacetum coccineum]|uniref:Polygalacturonase n=1 Tax=Tanacetum coccineum TaxID=301880 RepID=A0ABQ5EX75_9ASTR
MGISFTSHLIKTGTNAWWRPTTIEINSAGQRHPNTAVTLKEDHSADNCNKGSTQQQLWMNFYGDQKITIRRHTMGIIGRPGIAADNAAVGAGPHPRDGHGC